VSLIVVDQQETRWTGSLLSELGANDVAVVFCGAKHLPESVLLPYEGHGLMAHTMRNQLNASMPVKKRLWQTIIRAKVLAQAMTLKKWRSDDYGLLALLREIRSGDPRNIEAVAASWYFPALFGEEFVRERGGEGENARLNYGYAVLRAAVARAVVLAGMHPALGIFHKNRFDTFALADDLMEPLRPLVDDEVKSSLLAEPEEEQLTPPVKKLLLRFLGREVRWEGAVVPLDHALQRYATQVRAVLVGEREAIACPIVWSTGE